jgi:hypothetical protein
MTTRYRIYSSLLIHRVGFQHCTHGEDMSKTTFCCPGFISYLNGLS